MCLWNFDDVIIFSRDFQTQLVRLEQVLTCLAYAGLQLTIKMCHFTALQLTILGHIISKDRVYTDTTTLRAVAAFPKPTTMKALRSIIDLCSCF